MKLVTGFRRWLGDVPRTPRAGLRKAFVCLAIGGASAAAGFWGTVELETHAGYGAFVLRHIAILALGIGIVLVLHGLLHLLAGVQLLVGPSK